MAGLAKSVGTWVLGEGGCQRRSGVRVKGEMVSVVDGVGFTRRVGVGTVLRDGSPGVCREGGGYVIQGRCLVWCFGWGPRAVGVQSLGSDGWWAVW